MPQYDFPLWAADSTRFPTNGFRGAGWRLLAPEVPYARYGSKAWDRHFWAMRKKYPEYSVHAISNGTDSWIAPQIIAEAKSRREAQRVFEILRAALTILDGNSLFEFDDALVVPRNRKQLEDLTPRDLETATNTISRGGIVFGCCLAAAISKRKNLSYAGFKLTLSYKIASAHWMELHPRYYPKTFGVTKSLLEHVRMASAITLAYSTI